MTVVLLILLGLILGSFINAWVWRLHEQLDADGNLKKLSKKRKAELSITKGRSMCPNCKHELAAKDLVPVLSWLSLGGRCRYCKVPISMQYPLIELLVGLLFVTSCTCWPTALVTSWQWLEFVTWLGAVVGLVALALYDAKWFLLPNKIIYPLALLVFGSIAVQFALGRPIQDSIGIMGGVLVCSGFFWLLYQISRGKWIGGGDVKLGLVTGALIGTVVGGMLYLFIASMLGLTWSGLQYVTNKNKKGLMTQHIPFGPFLIVATYIVVIWGQRAIDWYSNSFLAVA